MQKELNPIEYLLSYIENGYTFELNAIHNPNPVRKEWRIPKDHVIDDFHILYVTKGNLTYTINNTKFNLTSGDFIFASNKTNYYASQDLNNPPSFYALRFGIRPTNQTRYIKNFYKESRYIKTKFPYSNYALSMFSSLYDIYFRKAQLKNLIIHTYITNILLEVQNQVKTPSINQIIKASLVHLKPPYGNELSITKIAASCNLSKSQYIRLFKKHYQTTPHQYRLKRKMEEARFLLEQTDLSIKAISITLGYKDPYIFSKQFKHYTNKSPSQWRKK